MTAVSSRPARLSTAQLAAVGLAVLLALAVVSHDLLGSYTTMSVSAERRGLPLASFVPAGIDGGLFSVVVLDPVLAWVGNPVGWLRQVVRLLSVGAVLLRRLGPGRGGDRDTIPATRCLLVPWRTASLWRRLVSWQVGTCREALDTELSVRRATAALRLRYGRRWRGRALRDVVWMPRTGIHVAEVCTSIVADQRRSGRANAADNVRDESIVAAVGGDPGARGRAEGHAG